MTTEDREIQNLLPEAKEFVHEVKDGVHKYANREYGHAAKNLALILDGCAEEGVSRETQRILMKEFIERQIEEFGPNIIDFLRDELKLVIENED
ncbi:hypothetical protein KKH23_03600 [Patescibacteria group bacterium]|uniref:Uncharacterized protein n=1 Tax=viral metagenome TaxID=1070528 RepID=A0A6M3MDF2_9ZZZZ|nr:hypothetical protein [Patescibacteria group bacterium]MBU0776871.1 hypothetical protein [Patescibacteria group bacterium]MBU0846250.1 hypothetical protein [Patescibacteria group bacterium]MBU0922597.1 hypothetical protein [Patescibacteria group bacterium]MBU1066648.1 hypothetical protein [Patescibacteria group bacterium]